MSHGLPRSKRSNISSQLTSVITLGGSKIVPGQPVTGTTPILVSGLNTGVGGSIVSVAVGAPGFGSILIQGFPKGVVQIEEAIASIQLQSSSANINATFSGSFSIGTTAAVDTALGGTASNIVPVTAISAATAGLSPITNAISAALSLVVNNADSVSGTGTKVVPGQPAVGTITQASGGSPQSIKTGPSLGFYLNLALSTVSTGAAPVTALGQVTLSYSVTGNY